jgi:hypothetical protein
LPSLHQGMRKGYLINNIYTFISYIICI